MTAAASSGAFGGGGDGGGSSAINIPSGLYNTIATEQGLGQYGTSLLNPLASMTNWAANIATGGQAKGQIPTFESQAIQAGPTVTFAQDKNKGALWTSSFDPKTGLVSFTSVHNPSYVFTESINSDPGAWGAQNFPMEVYNQWRQIYRQSQAKGGTTAGGQQLGPYLGAAWDAIQQMGQIPQQMTAIEQQTQAIQDLASAEERDLYGKGGQLYTTGQEELATGEEMLREATTGSGLYPSQARYVELAKQTGETNQAAMLAKLGLSESTMAPALTEQADLAAAATAGQLVQGNIQAAQAQEAAGQQTISLAQKQYDLAQGASKIALTAQTLSVGERQAVYDMYKGVSELASNFQKTMWEEALSGYGMIGSILEKSANAYGYTLQGYDSILKAGTEQARIAAAQNEEQLKADAQANADMFKALGNMFGSQSTTGGGSSTGGGGSTGNWISTLINRLNQPSTSSS